MQAAKKAGKSADTFYCLALLEDTGILTVPGAALEQCMLLDSDVTVLYHASLG